MLVFGEDTAPKPAKRAKKQDDKPVKKPAKTAQPTVNPLYDEVMALGEQCHFQELQVNGSLVIGPGKWCWEAYAERAVEHRIEQIKEAIRRKNETSDF